MKYESHDLDTLEDTDLIRLIGKPVTAGAYLKSDDSMIIQHTGTAEGFRIGPDQLRVYFPTNRHIWAHPQTAYILLTFGVEG